MWRVASLAVPAIYGCVCEGGSIQPCARGVHLLLVAALARVEARLAAAKNNTAARLLRNADFFVPSQPGRRQRSCARVGAMESPPLVVPHSPPLWLHSVRRRAAVALRRGRHGPTTPCLAERPATHRLAAPAKQSLLTFASRRAGECRPRRHHCLAPRSPSGATTVNEEGRVERRSRHRCFALLQSPSSASTTVAPAFTVAAD
jgi:hypothetical protein